MRLSKMAVAAALLIGLVSVARAEQPPHPGLVAPLPGHLAPPCCQDANICFRPDAKRECYTPGGVASFMSIWQAAVAKGVENAAIRAFNATQAEPPCVDGNTPAPGHEQPPVFRQPADPIAPPADSIRPPAPAAPRVPAAPAPAAASAPSEGGKIIRIIEAN